MEILKRVGLQKPKFLRQKYEPNLEFLGGRGIETEKPSVGEVWIFCGTTHAGKFHDSLQMTNSVICEKLSKTELKTS